MKRSKSGEHETDITQYIGTLEVSEQDGALTVVFTANAADGRYLNPVYIAKAIAEKLGFNEPYSVMRKKLMLSDGTEMREHSPDILTACRASHPNGREALLRRCIDF